MGAVIRDTKHDSNTTAKDKLEQKCKSIIDNEFKMLEREKLDGAMKQQLLTLQIQMLQNQMQQADLLRKLESTQNIIRSLEAKEGVEPTYTHKKELSNCTNEIDSITTCDYYHGPMSWQESSQLLNKSEEGTFLVRDSSDPRFLYSLSFQRGNNEGPTSVRIDLQDGRWSLDSDKTIRHLMPSFSNINLLIEYYASTEDGPVKLKKGLPCGKPRIQ